MPIPDIPHYHKTTGPSRTCPVCFAPIISIEDKLHRIAKCLNCGYSMMEKGSISDQGYYNQPILAFTTRKLQKNSYYELVDNVENSMYNMLIETGWNKNEAIAAITKDLGLKGDALDLFLRKVNGLD